MSVARCVARGFDSVYPMRVSRLARDDAARRAERKHQHQEDSPPGGHAQQVRDSGMERPS